MKACQYCGLNRAGCIDHVDAAHCPNTIPLKTKKRPIPKASLTLHKRTKLTSKQLERLQGEGGKGIHVKYSAKGEVSLELIRRLHLAKKRAKRYVLYTDQLKRRLYIADRELVKLDREELPLTFNIKEALQFFDGFDEPAIKTKYFNQLTNLQFNTKNLFK